MTEFNPGPPHASGPSKKSTKRSCCGCLLVFLAVILVVGIFAAILGGGDGDDAEATAPSPSPTQTEESEEPEENDDDAAEPSSASPTPSLPAPSASRPTERPAPTPTADPDRHNSVVSRVIDGDTVELANGDRVRLLGIDTPEVGECHANTATQRMRDLVEGREVALVRDGRNADRYDRLLRYIDVDGTDAGLTLIQEGLAVSRYDSRDGYGFHTREPDYIAADQATATQVCAPPPAPSTPAPAPAPAQKQPPAGNCDPNYTPCVPPYPPDINCSDIDFSVRVIGSDPHGLDRDGDGVGCEANG